MFKMTTDVLFYNFCRFNWLLESKLKRQCLLNQLIHMLSASHWLIFSSCLWLGVVYIIVKPSLFFFVKSVVFIDYHKEISRCYILSDGLSPFFSQTAQSLAYLVLECHVANMIPYLYNTENNLKISCTKWFCKLFV